MTLRILYSTREQHPTFRADVAVLFGKCLPRLGIESDLVALTSRDDVPAWLGGGVRLLRAPERGWLKVILELAQDLRLCWLAFGRCDVVQVRDNAFGALIALLASRVARKPFCYWMSFPFAEAWIALSRNGGAHRGKLWSCFKFLQGWVAKFLLYRIVLPNSDHVFVQSIRMVDDVVKKVPRSAHISAVPMGVDIEAIDCTPTVRGVSCFAGRRIVAYLGALERIRGPELLLDALSIVRKDMPDVLLLMIGDSQVPADREWLRQQIKERDLGLHVHVTGWLSSAEGWQWLRSAEIGLAPCPRSPYFDSASPTKVVEYMAHGLPVLANDHPDQAFVIRESGAGEIVSLTPAGFAAGILSLLATPGVARAMGARGAEWVRKRRSYQVLAAEVASTYRSLLAPDVRPDKYPSR
jgi:glycosyltransferase involved in cell wall biosynthesis